MLSPSAFWRQLHRCTTFNSRSSLSYTRSQNDDLSPQKRVDVSVQSPKRARHRVATYRNSLKQPIWKNYEKLVVLANIDNVRLLLAASPQVWNYLLTDLSQTCHTGVLDSRWRRFYLVSRTKLQYKYPL